MLELRLIALLALLLWQSRGLLLLANAPAWPALAGVALAVCSIGILTASVALIVKLFHP